MARWIKHPVARMLLVFALLQGAFWLVFYPVFVSPPRGEVAFIPVEAVEYARPGTADAAGLDQAEFAAYQPGPRMAEAGLHATRNTFTLEEVPERGLAILASVSGDNFTYYANGSFISGRGSMEAGQLEYRGNLRQIRHIPASALQAGQNTVTAITALDTPREALFAPPALAEYSATTEGFAWIEFLQSDFHVISTVATLILALLIGTVALRSSDPRLSGWLFALVGSWGIYTLIPIWVTSPLSGVPRVLTFTLAYCVFALAWPMFIDSWSRKPIRWFRWLMLAAFAILAGYATLTALLDPVGFTQSAYVRTIDIAGVGSLAVTFARLAWHFATNRREDRIWEGAVFLMLLFLIGWHFYDLFVTDRNNFMLERAQPFLLVALAIGFFAGRFHLFRSANQINTLLQERLDRREAELEEAHTREKLLVREQAFNEERQRIMRDMHDGLGSQLMGMLLAARRGKAEPGKVAEGLQQVIDELRLMIDSMDSVGDSLETALAGLRNRLQPRVEDAGFAFEWDNRLGADVPAFAPRKTLQLFRIMQEAVTNSLKHSGGSRIGIVLDRAADMPDMLEVLVLDDGKGIAGPRLGGHGLENMRARAAKEGGRVEYGEPSAGDGGRVRILLPDTPRKDAGEGQALPQPA